MAVDTHKPLQIAIDGPVASGKGDIAARLAEKLDLIYIYTGAMYRALALACIEKGYPTTNREKVLEVLPKADIDLVRPDDGTKRTFKVLLNQRDVTERIFLPDAAQGASDVGTIPEVRSYMVKKQQTMAQGRRVVIEGRDIGLRVLPNADLKIFLTASLSVRAVRRFKQWQSQGLSKTIEQTLEDTKFRDAQDTQRSADPLTKLPDSWELDTTNMDQDEVVSKIISELKKRNLI